MSVAIHPNLFGPGQRSAPFRERMGSMLALSLTLHILLVFFVMGLRLPAKYERPLSSYEVSLVAIPSPPNETAQVSPSPTVSRATQPVAKKVEPPSQKPVPIQKESPVAVMAPEPKPEPIPNQQALLAHPRHEVKSEPLAVPRAMARPRPMPPPAVKVPEYKAVPLPVSPAPRQRLDREILRGITLPPEAPRLTDLSSASSPTPQETVEATRTQRDIKKILGNLNVPEPAAPGVPPAREIVQAAKPAPTPTPMRPSVSDELNELNKKHERLQNAYKQMEQAEPPRQVAQARMMAPVPPPQATRTSLKHPATKLQAYSTGPGSNPYLQLVQQQISRAWVPPQVDPTMESFQVIVKFRLYRNGIVRDVLVEHPSGNEYYDLAGRRAVLSARLPEFPAEMTDQYIDAHFSFLVGEQTS